MRDNFERDDGIRHFRRALALERVNRISEAVQEYRRAVARYPHLREAHLALGFYYQRNQLLAKAVDEFHVATQLEDDFLSLFNLGHILVELGRYDEGLAALTRCLHFAPEDAATHYEIARIHFLRGDFQAAMKYLHLPLRSYPEDWEVQRLMGQCHFATGNLVEAMNCFEQALILAQSPQNERVVLEHIATIERYREFPPDCPLRCKDDLYVHHGMLYLGSSGDDGLHVAEFASFHFTYADIATTVRRFVAIQEEAQWPFTAVVAADVASQPLARAMGEVLHLPYRSPEAITSCDHSLVVLGVGREPHLMTFMSEVLPGQTTSWCLGVNWIRHSKEYPHIAGLIVQWECSVPWESALAKLRADGADKAAIQALIERSYQTLLQALRQAPPEPTITQQVHYYTRWHRRLRFC